MITHRIVVAVRSLLIQTCPAIVTPLASARQRQASEAEGSEAGSASILKTVGSPTGGPILPTKQHDAPVAKGPMNRPVFAPMSRAG
jgi:hypothetical protein